MIDLDEIGRIERRREPWGVGRVDSTADTGADERPACPPEKRWGRCPVMVRRPRTTPIPSDPHRRKATQVSEHSSPTELTAILADHKLWLYANGGKRADLRGADLHDADLRGADLRGADLRDADLRDADLRDANLRDADLRRADLRDADLRRADLRRADLYDVDLRRADLRRADLTNTCVVLLLDDDGRYYQVVAHAGLTSDGEALYLAGCRQLTITGARKHWTDPDHNNPEAAARILAAVEAHHTAWENAR